MKIKLTFEVVLDSDWVIDDETVKNEFNGSLLKAMKWLYKREGIFFNEPLKLVKAEAKP